MEKRVKHIGQNQMLESTYTVESMSKPLRLIPDMRGEEKLSPGRNLRQSKE
jgi:hypothetical protein